MTDILKKNFFFFFLVKSAGCHFGFFKRAGRHEKGAGRRALQKKPRQNTVDKRKHKGTLRNTHINVHIINFFMQDLHP